MKKIYSALGIIVLVLAGWYAFGNSTPEDVSVVHESDFYVYTAPVSSEAPSPLSEAEQAGLIFMREEEKLAHDVYLALYDVWGIQAFKNISESEATHTEAVRGLLAQYNVIDPVQTNERGVFVNQDIQGLYRALMAQGQTSRADALFVGATIEDLDIKDLQNHLLQTQNPDIQRVYANLMKGSRNHLRSFVSLLEREGQTYTAQYLTQAEVTAILESPKERGPAR